METDSYSGFGGSSDPHVNELNEPINKDSHSDPFRLIDPVDLHRAMNEVWDFYYRNSDQKLELLPVIAPTVTVEHGNGLVLLASMTRKSPYDGGFIHRV